MGGGGPVALRVGDGAGGGGALEGGAGVELGPDGGLAGLHQLLAAVALGQHPVLADRRRLAQLTGRSRPHAAAAGHRHPGEAGRQRRQVLDHPHVAQQGAGQRQRRPAAVDVVEQALGAGHG